MSNDLIKRVAQAKKRTIVKAYVQFKDKGELYQVMMGDIDQVLPKLADETIHSFQVETVCRKSALGLEDYLCYDARIEQGALIRKGAVIEKDAVILMGAVINTGASIGQESMVDMNAVIGSGAQIQKRCHIGAGAVIAGMMEPKGERPVVIEDDVLIGANAVILEEVTVGHHSVIGAGAVVTKDVEPYSVMAGVPAKKIKENHAGSFMEPALRHHE